MNFFPSHFFSGVLQCTALAAAIFGDPTKIEMVTLPFPEVWPAMANGTIDVSADGVTVLMSRDVYGVSSNFLLSSVVNEQSDHSMLKISKHFVISIS